MSDTTPRERVDALDAAITLGAGRLADDGLADAAMLVDKAHARLRHGTEHTVVALAGPTGAGKSTLFNALSGEPLSATGVRRPTTSSTHACVWGTAGGALLDWLEVGRRHHLETATDGPLAGLILLDLPDFDSTSTDHRLEVDRLVALVDLLVWVVDPEKYADETWHDGYLRPLAGHAATMRFVLNRIDSLDSTDTPAVAEDLVRRLGDDGIDGAIVLPISALEGHGIGAVESMLGEAVAARTAAVERLDADLRASANALSAPTAGVGITDAARDDLVRRLADAAGLDQAVHLVGAQYRRDAARRVGWPPWQWVRRRRRQPVADLPRVSASATAVAEVDMALRDIAEDAGAGTTGSWPTALRTVAAEQVDTTAEALTGVTGRVARAQRDTPMWWRAVGAVQLVLTGAATVGLAWLLAVALLAGFLRFDADPLLIETPGLEDVPLPSLLLVGGAVLGLLVALLARLPAAAGARRRGRRVRKQLRTETAVVADDHVLAPLATVLADHAEIERLLRVAGSG